MTNFLFGILLNVKGNHTGAMHFLKQALRVDLQLHDGRVLMLLKTLACREKFNVITGSQSGMYNVQRLTFSIILSYSFKSVCHKNTVKQRETLLYRFIVCFSVNTNLYRFV